jgi:hypothetical protein
MPTFNKRTMMNKTFQELSIFKTEFHETYALLESFYDTLK